jgi:hypothetical protein
VDTVFPRRFNELARGEIRDANAEVSFSLAEVAVVKAISKVDAKRTLVG